MKHVMTLSELNQITSTQDLEKDRRKMGVSSFVLHGNRILLSGVRSHLDPELGLPLLYALDVAL